MQQKKQPRLSWFTLDDGRSVKFDWIRFRDEVDKRIKSRKITTGDNVSKNNVFREVCQLLHPDYSSNYVDSIISTISKWYYGKNGPENLPEIYKRLAEFFGCEEDAFLIYEEIEEKKQMNTTAVQADPTIANVWAYPTVNQQMILAMERMKEKEAASELYGVLVDLIFAYCRVDEEFWCEIKDNERMKKLSEYPNRNPVETAIRKSAPYLSKEIRYRAAALLDDLYGERSFGWEELNRGELFSMDAFLDLKQRQLEEYVKLCEKNPKELSEDDAYEYRLDMMRYECDDLLGRIDDIFADYLCD